MSARLPKAVFEAVERGWAVIPVGLDKRPLFPWKEYQTQKPDLARVSDWAKLAGVAGWAVITGEASGIIVLDFDGEAGAFTMRTLRLSPHVRTGSGGYHVLFAYPGWRVPTLNAKTKRELGSLYPGMDIRADGGYAIFHGRNNTGCYEQLRDPGAIGSIQTLAHGARTVLGLNPPTQEPPASLPAVSGNPALVRPEKLVDKALAMVRAGEGRNNSGFWLAVQLRDNSFSLVDARAAMRRFLAQVPQVNTKGQREAYTAREAFLSLETAYRGQAREPWSTKDMTPQQPQIKTPAWAEVPSIGTLKAKPITYLVRDLIPDGSFVLFSGRSGSFKSLLALDIARAVATGSQFARLDSRPREVLYVDQENGYNLIAMRRDLMGIPADTPRLRYLGQWVDVKLGGIDSPVMLEYAALEKPLVVFDSLIRFGVVNENDNAGMAKIMAAFLRLSRAGATVILLHHAGYENKEGPKKDYRGATEIEAAPDICYGVRRDKGSSTVHLRQFKNRFAEEKDFWFDFKGGRFDWSSNATG
jgi:hypothetical protein